MANMFVDPGSLDPSKLPKSEYRLVTPQQAEAWLAPEINCINRPLRLYYVDQLVEQIQAGHWKLTHQGIGFSVLGHLIDGQHRLNAVVQSKTPLRMMVTTGLAEDTFDAIDVGLKRANHDRLHFVEDYAKNKMICQALRSYVVAITQCNTVTLADLKDAYAEFPRGWKAAVNAVYVKRGSGFTRADIVASLAVYYATAPVKAAEFAEGFLEGTGLAKGSPVLRLRTLALEKDSSQTMYWRSQAIMKAHLEGKLQSHFYTPTHDMRGNENKSEEVKERSIVRQVPHKRREPPLP